MVRAPRNVALRDKFAVAAPVRAHGRAAKDDDAVFIALDSCVWHLTPGTRHPPLRGPGTKGIGLLCFS